MAFQILNDLNDWDGDDHNKLAAGGDILGGRPTVLWALALEGLPPAKQEELLALVAIADARRHRAPIPPRPRPRSSTTKPACSTRPAG